MTHYVYQLQGNYGHGWEEVLEERDRGEALDRLQECREKWPEYPYRIVRRTETQT